MFPGPAKQPFSEFVVIEYPGVIKNTSKAFDTLVWIVLHLMGKGNNTISAVQGYLVVLKGH